MEFVGLIRDVWAILEDFGDHLGFFTVLAEDSMDFFLQNLRLDSKMSN